MELVIDDRESKIIKIIPKDFPYKITIKRIQYGDYIIYQDNKLLFVIERKTWSDLASSIKDGRKDNIDKLLSLRAETNCIILYLIEGPARYRINDKINRIPFKNLQSHLDHLIIRDKVSIIYSKNAEDTPLRLEQFITNFLTLKDYSGGSSVSVDITKPKEKTDMRILKAMWNSISGISDKTSEVLIFNITLLEFMTEGQKEKISELKMKNGRDIGNRVLKIIDNLNDKTLRNKTYINILSNIGGLSKASATHLTQNYNLDDLLNGQEKMLASANKSETRTVGEAMAKKIFKFLNLKFHYDSDKDEN
jgi:ERCC4-type nuclease